MSDARQRLPARRASESFSFEVGGLRFTATASRYTDGRIAELFLDTTRPGRAWARWCATLRSSSRSPSSTAPISTQSERASVATATGAHSGLSARRST
jgi:hypothetical protein